MWDRYIVVDTNHPIFQFDYVHDEAVVLTAASLSDLELILSVRRIDGCVWLEHRENPGK